MHQCFAYLEVDWTVEQNEIGQVWQMKFKMFLTGVIYILVEIEIYFVLLTKVLIFCWRCLNFFSLNSVVEFSENQKFCSSYFSISFILCTLSLNWTCWQVTVEISGYLCLDFEGSHSSVNIKGEKLQEELKFKNCIVYCDFFITYFDNNYRTN